jgi:hypothetical protein
MGHNRVTPQRQLACRPAALRTIQGFVQFTASEAITGHSGERAIPQVSLRQPGVCRSWAITIIRTKTDAQA